MCEERKGGRDPQMRGGSHPGGEKKKKKKTWTEAITSAELETHQGDLVGHWQRPHHRRPDQW